MKRMLLILLPISVLLSIPDNFATAEENLYVQPFRVKIYSKPTIASAVIGSVDSGFTFASTGKSGNWVKLSYMGTQGFIPVVQTAKTPPLSMNAVQSAKTESKPNIRARSSSTNSVVAGVKGLTYEDRGRITKGERCDYEALDRIDALKISPDELISFQMEGGKL